MDPIILTTEMIVMLGLLLFTVFLFVSEIIRLDLAAISILVLLGCLSYVPGLEGLVDAKNLFNGFASNAVISIIAVMIIGAGLDKTGLMSQLASTILRYGGKTEKRIIPIISSSVSIISSFMQNVGAAALYIPVVSRISSRTDIPLSRLLMPMGFCAILGGTLTMVGSSPLILLNDLIQTTNEGLSADQQISTFSLFSVTPIGLALVTTGIIYFVVLGKWVLPGVPARSDATSGQSMKEYLKRLYGLKADIIEIEIPEGNILLGQTLSDLMDAHHCYVIGTHYNGKNWIAPPITTLIQTPCRLAVLGREKVIREMVADYGLKVIPSLKNFSEDFAPTKSGVAEVVVPPDSVLVGKDARELSFRKTYHVSLLAIHRCEETFSNVET